MPAEDWLYSVTIAGNMEQCRTDAEISDSEGTVLAVDETLEGWQIKILVGNPNLVAPDFQAAVENAKENLSHYVNRRGENPPENSTWGAFSLWLMIKDDGTAMGQTVMKNPETR